MVVIAFPITILGPHWGEGNDRVRRANAIRTASLCTAFMLCILTGCSSQASSPLPAEVPSVTLPEPLTRQPIEFQQIIDLRDGLNREQLTLALKNFLSQWNINPTEKQEGFYILGRVLENSNKQTDLEPALAAFQISKDMPSLRQVSLWHASEVAILIGKEKVVRELLDQILKDSHTDDDRAKAQYSLAQSYLRANEPDRARAAFEAIQKQYAGSPYAIGSNYYLGELAWAKATVQKPDASSDREHGDGGAPQTTATSTAVSAASNQLSEAASSTAAITSGAQSQKEPVLKTNDLPTLKEALDLFTVYLKLSPAGHFAENARWRLKEARDAKLVELTDAQVDALAESCYSSGKWEEALALWSQKSRAQRLVEIATCQFHMKQSGAARATLLEAVKSAENSLKYVPAANNICLPMNKDEATKFWQEILQSLPGHKDAALWNVAIRLSPPASLQYFQRLVKDYPDSRYAAESNWWLFWEAAQHKTGKDLVSLTQQADKLALKYKTSKAAPRLLFWGGKIAEHAKNNKLAADEYRKVQQSYGSDYYAFRAVERLAQLQKKSLPFGWLKKYNSSTPKQWAFPQPSKLKDSGLNETAAELIKLKEYDETLQFFGKDDNETKSWVLSKLGQPLQSIATASKQLQEVPLSAPQWQYAYPLLYSSEMEGNCRRFSNVDPFLMHALVREESHYDPNALSPSKAIGLTQVMPATAYGVAKLLRIPIRDQNEFFTPELNLKLGTEYFSYSLSRFQNNSLFAVASYNGGAGAVKGWIAREHAKGNDDYDAFVENIPFRETRDYVRKVFGSYWNYIRVYGKMN
jgi:soluble lytic murein transglycosylase